MESCKIHGEKPAVTRCKICGSALCEECEKVHQKYHACPRCANQQLMFELANYKRGFKFVCFALACLLLDFALFVTELVVSKSITSAYMIASIIFFVLFAPFCIWLVINRVIKIKKLTEIIKLSQREMPSKQDEQVAKNFENEINNQQKSQKNDENQQKNDQK